MRTSPTEIGSLRAHGRGHGMLAVIVTGLMVWGSLLIVAPAQAAPPSSPSGKFTAPRCPGQVDLGDPNENGVDLTVVDGPRLAAYNAGKIVPLYDAAGWGSTAYPPVCGVHYVEGQGAVSEWMFCTDRLSKVCSDLDPATGGWQEAHKDDNDADVVYPVAGPDDLAGNPKLDAEQERLIAYLIQNGHSYAGVGDQWWNGVTEARSDGSTDERQALQTLVWCISDPKAKSTDYLATCAAVLPPEERTRLLTLTPAAPQLTMTAPAGADQTLAGKEVEFTISTNLVDQPLTLTKTSSPGVTLAVCGGPGTLSGSTLTVAGTVPDATQVVKLCASGPVDSTIDLAVSASPNTTQHIRWAQSPTKSPDGEPCQVFANFAQPGITLNARAAGGFVAAPQLATPKINTQVSHGQVKPGAAIFDTITISGFVPGHGSVGTATLYGPVSQRSAAMCTPGRVVARVRFTPRNGVIRTPAVKVTKAGVYTWVAETSADSHNKAASHACGLAAESSVVRKPTYAVPKVSTGFSGRVPRGSSARMPAAGRLALPALGIKGIAVRPVGVARGKMQVPANTQQVGWLNKSADNADAIGAAVIAGHVSNRRDRPGAMYRLAQARPGQVVEYRTASGQVQRYRVTEVSTFSRAKKLPGKYFATSGAHKLVLVSCAGRQVRGGKFHYTRNVVVTAVPMQ